MQSKKVWLKLLVSSMLILSSQAQDSLLVNNIGDTICSPLQYQTECVHQMQDINQSIDNIGMYLDGILNSLQLDSLPPY